MHALVSVKPQLQDVDIEWAHKYNEVTGRCDDYFMVKYGYHGDNGITVFLSPFQLSRLGTMIRQHEQDRDIVLKEEKDAARALEESQTEV